MADDDDRQSSSDTDTPFEMPSDSLNSVFEAVRSAQMSVSGLEPDIITNPLSEIPDETLVAAAQAVREMEETTERIESTLDIEPPWDYTPVSVDDSEALEALQWMTETREKMGGTNSQYLNKISHRIRKGQEIMADEVPSGNRDKLHGTVYIFVSSQDSLLHWLCDNDSNISRDNSTPNGEPVFSSSTKKEALEKWYDTYSETGIETGSSLSDKWESYFQHRHRIMHGHPDAYYDLNIAVAASWFFTLTSHVVIDRLDDI